VPGGCTAFWDVFFMAVFQNKEEMLSFRLFLLLPFLFDWPSGPSISLNF
jgi:hypothetical protein